MRPHARHRQRVRGGAFHSRPDLIRIVLHPARLRKVLLKRAVTAPDRAKRLIDDETRRACRALVDRENHSRPKVTRRPVKTAAARRTEDVRLLAETTS